MPELKQDQTGFSTAMAKHAQPSVSTTRELMPVLDAAAILTDRL
jgi:hypothetical protein